MTDDLKQFFASLPPHVKPANDTERLKMTFAWFCGQDDGLAKGLSHMNASLLRTVPEQVRDAEDEDHFTHEPDAKSASDSIDRENAASINRSNNRER